MHLIQLRLFLLKRTKLEQGGVRPKPAVDENFGEPPVGLAGDRSSTVRTAVVN